MKTMRLSLLLGLSLGLISTASAVPPGMTVEFTKSPMGKVTFDGKLHMEKGLMCDACHPKIFQQKKGTAQIKLTDHQADKFCFTCHNGTKSFKSEGNCAKCHKM